MFLAKITGPAVAAASLLALAGCGAQQPEAAAPAPAAVAVAPGGHLVDGTGRSLYLFTKDDQPGMSKCTGECSSNWPALTGEPQAGAGLDAAKLGSITRTDGARQVTYAGRPLYYFAQDKEPGDTAGQGKMQVWYLVNAAGEAVRPR